MSIAVAVNPANRSARLRALAAEHPYLTVVDIAKLTGESVRLVKLALTREDQDRRAAPVVEATGPLTAGQVAERTRMPIDAAKLFVR